MEKAECKENYWIICDNCKGDGKKRKKPRKKTRLHYQTALDQFKITDCKGTAPEPPIGQIHICLKCKGSGLIHASSQSLVNEENYPHVAIIGGGIGGAHFP